MNIDTNVLKIVNNAEKKLSNFYTELENIAFLNQKKVLEAFQNNNVALRHFSGTTGYGYDDIGRDTLCKVYADIFHCESAVVSPLIASGTHALTLALFGILRANDKMLAISGSPYDTLMSVIQGENIGSLKDFGVKYEQIELLNNDFDLNSIEKSIKSELPKLIFIGRSRGYEWRDALSVEKIGKVINFIKKLNKDIIVMVDNCYGEFMDTIEPTDVGADLMVGSLIKNAGGGLAPTGGYIAGTQKAVEQVAFRLTSPSIGMEIGSYTYGYQYFYQGVFIAPHITMNATKGSALFGQVFSDLGYEVCPNPTTKCNDTVRSIKFNTKDELISFVQSIQKASPIDSNVLPMPWAMPGYDDEVIMAAGTFVAGASIELSADSPIKEPYIAYVQGGLTYEHVKLAVIMCVQELLNAKK